MSFPSNSESVAQDQLRAFVERIERIEEEIKALNEDKSEVYGEAKGNGFDVKVLRKIIADRRKDYAARMEFETIYDLYAAALGMVSEAPRVHVHAREDMEWQAPRVVPLSDQRDAYRAGKPISQDFAYENASVYFFAFHEIGRIKVGVSSNVEQRLRDLSSEQRCEGEILHIMPGNRKAEMSVHARLAEWRVEGEWFRDCAEVRAIIETYRTGGHTLAQGEGQHGAQPLPDVSQSDPDKPAEVETSAAPVAPGKRRWTFTDKAHADCLNPEQCGGFSNLGLCTACKTAAGVAA